MTVVLFVAGVVGVVAGVVMVAFGIPVNEFTTGNALIISGTLAIVGGVIVIAIAAAIARLQQISDALMSGASPRSMPLPAPADFFKSSRDDASQVPFPPRPKALEQDRGAEPHRDANTDSDAPFAAPKSDWEDSRSPLSAILRDAPPLHTADEADETPLSPASPERHVPMFTPLKTSELPTRQRHPETVSRAPSETAERSPQGGVFDNMWSSPKPAAREPARPASESWKPSQPFIPPAPAKPDSARAETKPREQAPARPATEAPRPAVLKSGTVDGMGYTLYVDGSIEAELPQGTLRFASIAELRNHLEKNG